MRQIVYQMTKMHRNNKVKLSQNKRDPSGTNTSISFFFNIFRRNKQQIQSGKTRIKILPSSNLILIKLCQNQQTSKNYNVNILTKFKIFFLNLMASFLFILNFLKTTRK